jgi:hypothetical protein
MLPPACGISAGTLCRCRPTLTAPTGHINHSNSTCTVLAGDAGVQRGSWTPEKAPCDV